MGKQINKKILYYRNKRVISIEDINFANLVRIKTKDDMEIVTNMKNLTSKPICEKYITMSLLKGGK